MTDFRDDWEEQVRNTSPLTLKVWTIDTKLEFPIIPSIDEFEVLFAVEARLAEAVRLFSRKSAFVIPTPNQTASLEGLDSDWTGCPVALFEHDWTRVCLLCQSAQSHMCSA